MTPAKMLVGALGGLVLVPEACPVAKAQSGHALVLAEQLCLNQGVTPSTAAYNACVARAARAYDNGQPQVADRQARAARDARELCLSDGLSPETLGYRHCVATQLDRPTAP